MEEEIRGHDTEEILTQTQVLYRMLKQSFDVSSLTEREGGALFFSVTVALFWNIRNVLAGCVLGTCSPSTGEAKHCAVNTQEPHTTGHQKKTQCQFSKSKPPLGGGAHL